MEDVENNEYYLLSEELDEYPWDIMSEIKGNDNISIWSSPSGSGLRYFKVFNSDYTKFCRISMYEAKFIGREDETLNLTSDDIKFIVSALTEPMQLGESGWYWLIYENNYANTLFQIDEDLPMPDYTKLLQQ